MRLGRHSLSNAEQQSLSSPWKFAKQTAMVLRACTLTVCFVLLVLPAASQASLSPNATPSAAFQNDLDVATRGDVAAQLRVAKSYNEGTTGTGRRKYREAFKWFQTASQGGSVEASAWLGSLYLFGQGTPQDVARGANLIQLAAAADNAVGLRFLGVMYESGQGVPQDYKNAVIAYSKAMANGDANAFDHLGLLYLRGLGVHRDAAKAFDLLSQGAKLGDQWAQLHLGELYEQGRVPTGRSGLVASSGLDPKLRGGTLLPDYVTALKLYRDAVAQDNRVAEFKLGQMYEHGRGVGQDYDQAFAYYEQSASHQFAPAILALGIAHELGRGTSVNLVHAYIAYSLVSEMDNPAGAVRLQSLIRRMTPAQIEEAHTKLNQVKLIRAQMINN